LNTSNPNAMDTRTLIAAALIAFTGLSQAAVVVASDNFDTYASGALAGANAGTGWASGWTGSTGASVVAVSGADTPMAGQAARFGTPNADVAASRQMSQTISQDRVFVDFLLQFDSGTISNNDFLGLWFGNTSGPNIGLKANCGQSPNSNTGCTADLFARTTGTNGQYSTNIAIGQTLRLVGLLEKTGNATNYNRYSLWVDPTSTELASFTGADAVFTGLSNISSFNTIGFRSVNLGTADGVLIDKLRIGVVPEPGSLALVGAALLGLGVAARRKRA
jgi:hypothetical protein